MGVYCVFHRDCGFSSSIVFGCDPQSRESIAARIENSESASYHPMLIIGIVAEIERDRHMHLVERQVESLLKRVYALSNEAEISENSQLRAEHYPIDSWVRVSQLRKGLLTWKEQLLKMIDHIAEFEAEVTRVDRNIKLKMKGEEATAKACSIDSSWRDPCLRSGRRIRKRLIEIVNEYDEKIRACSIVIDGVSLAAQMVRCIRVASAGRGTNAKTVLESHRLPGSPIQPENRHGHAPGLWSDAIHRGADHDLPPRHVCGRKLLDEPYSARSEADMYHAVVLFYWAFQLVCRGRGGGSLALYLGLPCGHSGADSRGLCVLVCLDEDQEGKGEPH